MIRTTILAGATLALATSVLGAQEPTKPREPTTATPVANVQTREKELDFESALKAHVEHLATTIGERNLKKYDELCEAADYIETEFKNYGLKPARQTFKVRGLDCYNIAAEIKGSKDPDQIIIVGAHYDSAEGTPGANDNGSGTAAMLVMAKHFANSKPERTLRFVAFTNEEPPYFQTQDEMGSWVYAEMCRLKDQNIAGVISLETMGYFTDEKDSQHYPAPLDRLYPSTGNFVGFVGNIGSGKLMRNALKTFQANSKVPAEGAALPGNIPGVGWSDHWSFWQEGYEGIMITDTAPYRYPHYHKATDTPDKLNFPVFAKVVEGLVEPVKQLVKSD
jgi:hypothetical protein